MYSPVVSEGLFFLIAEALIDIDLSARLQEDFHDLECNETLVASPLNRGPRPEMTRPDQALAFADVCADTGILTAQARGA